MLWRDSPYTLLWILTAAMSVALAVFIWRRRPAPGVRSLVILILCAAGWALAYALGVANATLPGKIFWAKAEYLAVVTAPPAWLGFVLRHTRQERWLTRRRLALLAVEPLLTLALVWSNEAHGLIWRRTWLETSGALSTLGLEHGLWFYVHTAYCYALGALGLFLLAQALGRAPHLYRSQTATILIAALLLWLANALDVAFPALGLIPFALALPVAGLILAWSLLRHRLFELVPVARAAVMENMEQAVLVLDVEGRIVDLNQAAQKLLGRTADHGDTTSTKEPMRSFVPWRLRGKRNTVIGQAATQVFSAYPDLVARIRDLTEAHDEIVIGAGQARRHFDLHLSPLQDRHGHLIGHLLVLHDITARKQAEEELRRLKEFNESIVQNMGEGLVVTDVEGRLTFVNPAAVSLLGHRPEELLGQPLDSIVPPDQKAILQAADKRRKRGRGERCELEVQRKDGTRVPVLVAGSPRSEQGRFVGMVTVLTEIGERKQAEEALCRRAEELAALQATVLDITTPHGLPTLLETIVERAARLLNAPSGGLYLCDPQQQEVRCVVSFNTPRDDTGVVLRYGEGVAGTVAKSGKPLIVDNYRLWPDRTVVFEEGKPFAAVVSAPMVWRGEVIGVIHVLDRSESRHFTQADLELLTLFANHAAIAVANGRLYEAAQQELAERKRTDEELRRLKEFNEGIVTGVAEALLMEDAAGLITFVNPALEKLLGYTAGELVGCHWQKIVAQGEVERVQARTAQRPAGVAEQYETRLRSKEGGEIPTLVSARPLFAERVFAGVLSAFTDITDRVQAEQALRDSEERYRTLVHNMPLGIYRRRPGPQGQFLMANPAFLNMFGFDSLQALNEAPVQDLCVHYEDRKAFTDLLATGESMTPAELQFRRKDGSPFWGSVTARVVRDERSGEVAYLDCTMEDITARKRAEEEREKLEAQLRQAQKMETVGLLAGGVAHEFNNMLTVIQGNAELSLAQLDPSHRLYKGLQAIQRTAKRAAILTRELLAFSRRQILQPQALDLNTLVAASSRMLGRIIGEQIELQVTLASQIGPVFADESALEQVLMNLALNARDAMPEGGTLRIETAPVTFDQAYCSLHPEARVGEYVRLTVADTGLGMDEATQAHLFEPFFTTKEVGKGTGLGLAMVYGIVKQHEGLIEVQSQVGQGTRFDIYLPVYPAPVPERSEAQPASVPGRRETILVAEDEETVREFAQTVLEGLGYTVLLARDGLQAMKMFTANQEGIDLVILDAVMPKLSGQKAYEAMSAVRPDLPVLFITGWAAEMAALSAALSPGLPVLQKPFTVEQLGRKVREALDTARNT